MSEAATAVINDWDYQTSEVLAVPYNPSIKGGVFPEHFLVDLYGKTKEDSLFRRAFPGSPEFDLNGFVSYFYTKTMIVGIKKPDTPVGYSWIYEVDGNEKFKKASVGVVFFKEFWGESFLHDLGRLFLSWYFNEAGINILYGTIASWNRASVRFGKSLGFERVGLAPMFFMKNGMPIDVEILFIKREEFSARGTGV
jgi:Acetyltransferase (GNAT) domain